MAAFGSLNFRFMLPTQFVSECCWKERGAHIGVIKHSLVPKPGLKQGLEIRKLHIGRRITQEGWELWEFGTRSGQEARKGRSGKSHLALWASFNCVWGGDDCA